MSDTIQRLANELRRQGPQRFADWNVEAFDSYVEGPVGMLQRVLEWQDDKQPDPAAVANFLRLIYEGVGAGWLRVVNRQLPPPTFLAHCLTTLVPSKLGEVPRDRRAAVLRDVWNLGEGMAHQPQWLNQYAITQTGWSTDLVGLQQHLTAILEPVLSPPDPISWNGRYTMHVVDLRERSDAFVPGRMYLAAPVVLCIENRLDPDETLGMLLRRPKGSEVLGSVGRLPEYAEMHAPPRIETTPDAIVINGTAVDAPLISSPRQVLCAAAGFVAVTADDSQRLWLVEST